MFGVDVAVVLVVVVVFGVDVFGVDVDVVFVVVVEFGVGVVFGVVVVAIGTSLVGMPGFVENIGFGIGTVDSCLCGFDGVLV